MKVFSIALKLPRGQYKPRLGGMGCVQRAPSIRARRRPPAPISSSKSHSWPLYASSWRFAYAPGPGRGRPNRERLSRHLAMPAPRGERYLTACKHSERTDYADKWRGWWLRVPGQAPVVDSSARRARRRKHAAMRGRVPLERRQALRAIHNAAPGPLCWPAGSSPESRQPAAGWVTPRRRTAAA